MGFAFLLGPWLRVPLGRNLIEVMTGKFSQVLVFRSPAYPLEIWAAWAFHSISGVVGHQELTCTGLLGLQRGGGSHGPLPLAQLATLSRPREQ